MMNPTFLKRAGWLTLAGVAIAGALVNCRDFDSAYEQCVAEGHCVPDDQLDGGILPGDDGGTDGGTTPGDDGGTDGGPTPENDGGTDGGTPLNDAGMDAGDAGTDAGDDAGSDAGMDAGDDAGTDAGDDGGTDAGPDAGPVFNDAGMTVDAAVAPQ